MALFPDAQLHWFANCGHVPQLDVTAETVALILAVTEGRYEPQPPVSTSTKESEVTGTVFLGMGVAVVLVGLFLTFGLKR
ncbi:alpha/beta fold hydrolase [Spirosoma pulveris]